MFAGWAVPTEFNDITTQAQSSWLKAAVLITYYHRIWHLTRDYFDEEIFHEYGVRGFGTIAVPEHLHLVAYELFGLEILYQKPYNYQLMGSYRVFYFLSLTLF